MNSDKSQMRPPDIDETLLIRYLLGKVDDEEKVQVEDRAFADPEYLSAIQAVESDLIDAYVRKELPKSDRGAFERQYFTSPSRRRKVEFARTFFRVVTDLGEARISERRSAWQIAIALFRGWHPGLQFAAGLAALACLIAGSWLMVDNALLRSRVAALESRQRDAELQREVLQRKLTEEQSRGARLTQLGKHPSAENGPVIASLVLAPGISRAQSNVQLLALDPSVQVTHIEIELDSRDEFRQFRAGLHTRAGTEVLTFGSLNRHRTATGNVVSFDVPASALATGEYELALQGLSPGEPLQGVGYYYFRVQKR